MASFLSLLNIIQSDIHTPITSTMASNRAAWLTAEKAKPLQVKEAPLGVPEENQILVKNHAIAINPVDGGLQEEAFLPLQYPYILGEDVAGEVVDVGPNVVQFKKGDRVIGLPVGFVSYRTDEKGFQLYTLLRVNMSSKIPDSLSFERAVVIPLGLATAASGLFRNEFLNLHLPTNPASESNGKLLLIWGGATCVGSNAIQLAVAAGYEVISTASPKNFDYVKSLGASQVFDYNSSTVISDLLHTFKGKASVGALDAVGGSTWAPVLEFVQKSEGVKFVATVIPGFPDPPEGIKMNSVFGSALMGTPIAKAIFEDFLPKALQSGAFLPSPEPLIAGRGLESIQDAIDLQRKGVSARKVVVLL